MGVPLVVPNDIVRGDMWHTDRSRYVRGFECRWKRLLEYHAFGTGIRLRVLDERLATGRYTHAVLEKLLKRQLDSEGGGAHWSEDVKRTVNTDLVQVLTEYQNEISSLGESLDSDELKRELDLVTGMSHGYARCVLPFVAENFRVVAVEQEYNYRIPHTNIIWMARPDFVAYSRDMLMGQGLGVHDFKTTSYWSQDEGPKQWANNIQMMANAATVAANVNEPVTHYFMHMLVKGNKRYPNLLTTAYFRPGNPPFNEDSWKHGYTRERAYSKVRVADFRNLPDWIWEVEQTALQEKFPVVGPYSVHTYTTDQFFRGVASEENWWQDRLDPVYQDNWTADWKKPTFQAELDSAFPRTYNCVDFTGRKCQFWNLCHKQKGWEDPFQIGFVARTPHHPQEGKEIEDVG